MVLRVLVLLAAHRLRQHVVDVEHADIGARHAGDLEAGHAAGAGVGHLDLDLLVVEFAVAQLLAEAVAGGRARGLADQRFQHALLGVDVGARLDVLAHLLAHQADGDLDQVADDLLDVAADIADLGELGRLDLDEGRAGEPAPGGARSRSCRRRSARSSGCSSASPLRASGLPAAGGASGCAARWPRRAWRPSGR